jgi:hypothetical protein
MHHDTITGTSPQRVIWKAIERIETMRDLASSKLAHQMKERVKTETGLDLQQV